MGVPSKKEIGRRVYGLGAMNYIVMWSPWRTADGSAPRPNAWTFMLIATEPKAPAVVLYSVSFSDVHWAGAGSAPEDAVWL